MANITKQALKTRGTNQIKQTKRMAISRALYTEFSSKHFAHWFSDKGAFGLDVMGNADSEEQLIVWEFLDKLAGKILDASK